MPSLYSTLEAARYLGCTKDNVTYHRVAGNLEGTLVGNSYVFGKGELDRFLGAHSSGGITKGGIAELYGVSKSLVTYRMGTGEISPVGKRGKALVFCPEEAEKVFGKR